MIIDSGERTKFMTGAERDLHGENKGRMDLVPLGIVGSIMKDPILVNIDLYITTGRKECLVDAFKEFARINYPDIPTAILDVSIHYRDGSRKYQERNWERGIPLHSFIDSASRHYMKHLRGDTDEPHHRAFMWNVLGAIWTHTNKPEMNDLPWANKEIAQPLDVAKIQEEIEEADRQIGIFNPEE